MILLLDTSTPLAGLIFIDGDYRVENQWQADRQLAKGLLGWLEERLKAEGKTWDDITGIGTYRGPGSFTGLRIGLTVLNTLADSLAIPIVGVTGDDWIDMVLRRLQSGENDKITLPYYATDANITTPRK